MSKASKESLFGITLTELVIILFIIMLLLSLFNIDELQEQVSELTLLVPESEEDIVSASAVVELLIPDAEIQSDLIPLDVIREEIKKLQEDKKELEDIKSLAEGEGDGDCREGGFWITSKCADHCWEITSEEVNRQYEYLVDIGICESSVVVQQSQWIEKTNEDFMMVEGAAQMLDHGVMSSKELFSYLDAIKEPGFLKEPRQCFYSVRLVDLGARSIARWENIEQEVANRVGRLPVDEGDKIHPSIKKLFPDDICDVKPQKAIKPISNNIDNTNSGANLTPIGKENITTSSINTPNDEIVQSQTNFYSEPVASSSINRIAPKMNAGSFNDEFFGIRQCKNTRSDELQLTFIIDLDAEGKAIEVRYKGDASSLSGGNRKIESITRRALLKTSFTPENIEGVNLSSQFEQTIKRRKDICL